MLPSSFWAPRLHSWIKVYHNVAKVKIDSCDLVPFIHCHLSKIIYHFNIKEKGWFTMQLLLTGNGR